MVHASGGITTEFENIAESITNYSATKMTDMHFLCNVWGRKVYQNVPFDSRTQLCTFGFSKKFRTYVVIGQAKVYEPRSGNGDGIKHFPFRYSGYDFISDVTRTAKASFPSFCKCRKNLHSTTTLEVAQRSISAFRNIYRFVVVRKPLVHGRLNHPSKRAEDSTFGHTSYC